MMRGAEGSGLRINSSREGSVADGFSIAAESGGQPEDVHFR